MNYTVFLDRDGVINADSPDYIKKPSEFHFLENAPEAVAVLCKNGFDVMIITNQSVINRKMASHKDLEAIFDKMRKGIEKAGGKIKDIFFCPHMPDQGCTCRKPRPGLILQAAEKYDIDLTHSCMVGDSVKDMECAENAGCGARVLVKTGNGERAAGILSKRAVQPDCICKDLMAAAEWISGKVEKLLKVSTATVPTASRVSPLGPEGDKISKITLC